MTRFNKRHYEAIAKVMQETHPGELEREVDEGEWTAQEQWENTVYQLATLFGDDNSRFDRSRFLHACKPGSNVKARTAHLKVA